MANITVLGAGLAGLGTAMLLSRDGHRVTVLERDGAPPPPGPAAGAWDDWARPGVAQFRLPHYMVPRWWQEVRATLPELVPCLVEAGAAEVNPLADLPAGQRGDDPGTDVDFGTVTARRPVLETAFARAAAGAGVTVRRGVRVTGLVADDGPPAPRVTGVATDAGTVAAELVVDCGGRHSRLPAWLEAAGARRPAEERSDSGMVYYGRHFTSRGGGRPRIRSFVAQPYDSLTVLTLPGDNDTWSVVLATAARDKQLSGLRDPAAWSAALARYPLAAHWADGEPLSDVDVMAGIEDRHRSFVLDGEPVATGVVAVGDAWACTNPSVGRGAAFALLHGRLLRDVLRAAGLADLVGAFAEATTRTIEPLYRATCRFDRHRRAELDGDAAGRPYRPDDPGWAGGKALFAAALHDPELTRAYLSIASFLRTPDEVFATPGLGARVMRLGASAPQYPLPGPDRAELLAAVTRGAAR